MSQLSLSARSMASALADPFTKLSFICVNLRNLRENRPFTHAKKKHISGKLQEDKHLQPMNIYIIPIDRFNLAHT